MNSQPGNAELRGQHQPPKPGVIKMGPAARITLVEGESLEFRKGEAYLTLRLDGDAARWFAENLPRHDGITETFAAIAARLEAVGV